MGKQANSSTSAPDFYMYNKKAGSLACPPLIFNAFLLAWRPWRAYCFSVILLFMGCQLQLTAYNTLHLLPGITPGLLPQELIQIGSVAARWIT